MSDISIKNLSEVEKFTCGIRNISPSFGMFQLDSEKSILEIFRTAYNGEPLHVLYGDSNSISEYEACTEAYFFVGAPYLAHDKNLGVYDPQFITNRFTINKNASEIKKNSEEFFKEMPGFVNEKMPTLSKLFDFSYHPEVFKRIYVKFDENKVPIFVSNKAYMEEGVGNPKMLTSLDFSKDLTVTDDRYKQIVDPEIKISLSPSRNTVMATKNTITFNGLMEESDGSVSMLINKHNKNLSHFTSQFDFDILQTRPSYKDATLILNSSASFPTDEDIVKIPVDTEFFSIYLTGIRAANWDEKGLKSVFSLQESVKNLSTESVSSRYLIISSKDNYFYTVMKSSIGKSAQESIRITKSLTSFFSPFVSFIIQQCLLHDMVFKLEDFYLLSKELSRHAQTRTLADLPLRDETFLECFNVSGKLKALFKRATSGEQVSLSDYTLHAPYGKYFHSFQPDFTKFVYKSNKNMHFWDVFYLLCSNSFVVRYSVLWTEGIAKLGIDNILFSNEVYESTINHILATKSISHYSMTDITFPIASVFTLSTDSNELITKLLSSKSAQNYNDIVTEDDGKYIKHLKTVCKENVENTDGQSVAVLTYLNTIIDAFELAAKNLCTIESERKPSKVTITSVTPPTTEILPNTEVFVSEEPENGIN